MRISQVFRTLLPRPDLGKAAGAMAEHPRNAKLALTSLVEVINRDGHRVGLGFTGSDSLSAEERLRSFVQSPEFERATREDFARLLMDVRQLEAVIQSQGNASPLRHVQDTADGIVRRARALQNFEVPQGEMPQE